MSYDPLYTAFFYYFNVERDYFECHEVMEELWLEEGRDLLYQGLLQVAVALYHFRNNNLGGALKLMKAAVDKLEQQPDRELGIDRRQLLAECRLYEEKLRRYEAEPFAFYDLDIRITDPRLQAETERLRLHPPRREGGHA